MNTSPRPLIDRLMRIALTILIIAVSMSLSWHLIRNILPVLVIGGVVIASAILIRNCRKW